MRVPRVEYEQEFFWEAVFKTEEVSLIELSWNVNHTRPSYCPTERKGMCQILKKIIFNSVVEDFKIFSFEEMSIKTFNQASIESIKRKAIS